MGRKVAYHGTPCLWEHENALQRLQDPPKSKRCEDRRKRRGKTVVEKPPLRCHKYVPTPAQLRHACHKYVRTPAQLRHACHKYVPTPAQLRHACHKYVRTPAQLRHACHKYVRTPAQLRHACHKYVPTPAIGLIAMIQILHSYNIDVIYYKHAKYLTLGHVF